jgi:hypothetical protein
MNRSRSAPVALLLLGLFAAGCKQTVEGQQARWASLNRSVDELGVLYPGFLDALAEQSARAAKLHETAQGIADEKERIRQLSSAGDALGGGFVAELLAVDAKLKALRTKLVDVSGAATDPAEQRRVDQAIVETRRTLADVEGRLKGGARTASDAGVLLTKITADLRSAEALLARAAPAKDKVAVDAGAAASAAAPVAPAPAASWKCEFCDSANAATADKCSNCGAARPAAAPGK